MPVFVSNYCVSLHANVVSASTMVLWDGGRCYDYLFLGWFSISFIFYFIFVILDDVSSLVVSSMC